jgi:hypothetical protein
MTTAAGKCPDHAVSRIGKTTFARDGREGFYRAVKTRVELFSRRSGETRFGDARLAAKGTFDDALARDRLAFPPPETHRCRRFGQLAQSH